ncbi:META and DUF4377 domain-containing protein [Acidovorax sp. MR-S7]|uniref:META and DUF4377 domain-containing protein n=1 Tax=Acidovorax sp. MR-S7 TaxID=1268622 RepID=UPI00036DA7EC|nr:META and DUF4377 domain-containing protein [Acidovorax sp. MR-S7]GAD23454.1 hypothetical protein AVS7_03214 [Acidovorax sp. MR-S7]
MNHTSFFTKTVPALGLAALLAACGSAPQGASVTPTPPPANASTQLQAYDWDLAAAYDGRGQAAPGWRLDGRPAARLHFGGQQLSVQNLCNTLGAGYTLEGSRLQVSRPMSTLRACADRDLMALEQRVAAQLPQAQRVDLRSGAAPQLVLHFADGSRWELAGTPTPQTKYGGAGERIFLEVAPQRAACSHGVVKGAQCLRVREVRYGDNGVKLGTGEWQLFYSEIEGYTHEPGIRNVLRVNRFKRQNVPADALAYAYVLDMVVESERTR